MDFKLAPYKDKLNYTSHNKDSFILTQILFFEDQILKKTKHSLANLNTLI